MKLKNILIVCICVLVVISSLNVASAGFFDFLNPDTVVEINGVNFTVSNEFTEDVNQTYNYTDELFNSTTRHFDNEDFDFIEITVDKFDESTWMNAIADEFTNASQKNISDIKGYYYEEYDVAHFIYDDSEYTRVHIIASNQNMIKELLDE